MTRMTNPTKVLFPDVGLTKFELAEYYFRIADHILPHIVDRPLSLVRCPEGTSGQRFYQKYAPAGLSDAVLRVDLPNRESPKPLLAINNIEGLVALVQFSVLEIHPWGSRRDRPERPDRMTFDLDPDPQLPWSRVIEGAKSMRDCLTALGLKSFVKTSGSKGLHVVVPIDRIHEWPEVKRFAGSAAGAAVRLFPKLFTTSPAKPARKGRIYIDYLRNARGSTTVAPYSTRVNANAAISFPVTWDQLEEVASADAFTVREMIASASDPWREMDSIRQRITKNARALLGMP